MLYPWTRLLLAEALGAWYRLRRADHALRSAQSAFERCPCDVCRETLLDAYTELEDALALAGEFTRETVPHPEGV